MPTGRCLGEEVLGSMEFQLHGLLLCHEKANACLLGYGGETELKGLRVNEMNKAGKANCRMVSLVCGM